MRDTIINSVYENKVIAIVRGMEPEDCVGLAKALYAGGIKMMEVTFNQRSTDHFEATTKAIRAINETMEGKVLVGAGTVLTTEQVDLAKEAGAQYIISPSVDEEVIRYTREQGLVSMPGAMTPSEAVTAYKAGADFVKIFPVGNLGSSYIKAMKAPLSHIPFLAVGGVNEKNVAEFLAAGAVGVGVGGNLVNAQWIKAGNWEALTDLAKQYVEAAK